ncbi:MAG TPA: TIGR03619 family F420-dependent LLM class oxidoreductase [Acidimicrobiia bacterium]|nr:TIGR03619 family F420-dependent LLM class oxidoreductase [Acidimicrobiia bacterium]
MTTTRRLEVSLTISGFTRLFDGDLRAVLDVARGADDAGVHQLVLADHVVMGTRTDRYPYGRFPYGPEEPWPEPLTLLAAFAAVTTRARLGTGILISPLRPAVLLAKAAATLDQLCDGRLDLGVGVGWQREEYAAVGVPWGERHQNFDDQLGALAALFTTEPPTTFRSATIAFDDVWCEPRPRQQHPGTGIPLWFGVPATGDNVARMAAYGAGWLPIHTTPPDALRDGIARLRDACAAAGRDPSTFGVRAGLPLAVRDDGSIDLDESRARAAELAQVGVTTFAVGLGRHLRDRSDVHAFVAALGELSRG